MESATPKGALPDYRDLARYVSKRMERLRPHMRHRHASCERADGTLDYLTDDLRRQARLEDTEKRLSHDYDPRIASSSSPGPTACLSIAEPATGRDISAT